MSTTKRKWRTVRILSPGENPTADTEEIVQAVNDALRQIEGDKISASDLNVTGAQYGDILVADVTKRFQPQKFVPRDLGIGLSAAPQYRLDVLEGLVDMHFTEDVTAGFHGLVLNKQASDTTHRHGVLLSVGSSGHWELSEDTDSTLILRSVRGPLTVVRLASGGAVSVSGDAALSGALTVNGATLLKAALEVSGDATLDAKLTVTGAGLLKATLEVSGAATLDATLLVKGTLEASGNATLDADLIHKGTKVGFNGAAAVAKDSAYTQTYSAADRTLGAYTANNQSSAYTGIDNLQAGSPYAKLADVNTLRTAVENLRAFTEDAVQMLNALVDFLQLRGDVG